MKAPLGRKCLSRRTRRFAANSIVDTPPVRRGHVITKSGLPQAKSRDKILIGSRNVPAPTRAARLDLVIARLLPGWFRRARFRPSTKDAVIVAGRASLLAI